MFKLVLEKAKEPEIKWPISTGSSKKQRVGHDWVTELNWRNVEGNKVCLFFLFENSRPLSPWGPLDFLSTCLGNDLPCCFQGIFPIQETKLLLLCLVHHLLSSQFRYHLFAFPIWLLSAILWILYWIELVRMGTLVLS